MTRAARCSTSRRSTASRRRPSTCSITVMSEQELHVPRLRQGGVAAPGFRLVAAMNPFDAVGTARISSAVYDRMCRLSMTYQSADRRGGHRRAGRRRDRRRADRRVARRRSSSSSGAPASTPTCASGSSVRGALDAAAGRCRRWPSCAASRSTNPSRRPRRGASSRCRAGSGCARARCARREEHHHRAVGGDLRPCRRRRRRATVMREKSAAPTGATSSR